MFKKDEVMQKWGKIYPNITLYVPLVYPRSLDPRLYLIYSMGYETCAYCPKPDALPDCATPRLIRTTNK